MTQNANTKHRLTLLGTVAVALGLATATVAQAQQPMLNAVATHTAFHPPAGSPALLAALPLPPQNTSDVPPVQDDLFAGTEKFAKGASDVTEVNMDPSSLNMVNGPDAHRAHNMVLNVVKTYTYDKPGMYNPADLDEFRHRLDTGDWHCSVHTRDLKNGNSTDVCNRRRAPDMVENAIITASPKSLTFIHTIRKANGQGGEVNFNTSPGFSMVAPDVDTGALSASMPSMEDLHIDVPRMVANLREQFKDFHFDFKPMDPEQVQHLRDQLRKLQNQPPTRP